MQVFVPYQEPIEVARCLDQKRLNRQISETKLIIEAIEGKNGWIKSPVVKMWKDHKEWLVNYRKVLYYYNMGDLDMCVDPNAYCIVNIPEFLTEEFCDQHKRRLYTKDTTHYFMFRHWGISFENWYSINGEVVKYVEGKKIRS